MKTNGNPVPHPESNYEMRYATYSALEKLKTFIWRDYDHEKATVVVCVWDGVSAVDSINVFTAFENAIERRNVDIRVELKEINGADLEDQAGIVMFLPTYELHTRVTPAMAMALTDTFLAQLIRNHEETSKIIRRKKAARAGDRNAPSSAVQSVSPAPITAETSEPQRPVFISDAKTGIFFPFFKKKPAKKHIEVSPSKPSGPQSPIRSALTSLANEILRKYPNDSNHVVICAWEGKTATDAIAIYTALKAVIESENFPVTLHIKHIESTFLRELGPLVLTSPTEAIYTRVTASDAGNIIRRTVMNGEILDALLYQEQKGMTPRSLTISELTDLALPSNDSTATDNDLERLNPIELLIPGKATFRDDALEILNQPELRERIDFTALTLASKKVVLPSIVKPAPTIPSSTDGESSLMTVEELFRLLETNQEPEHHQNANKNPVASVDPTQIVRPNQMKAAFDELIAKSEFVSPTDQPQLLISYNTFADNQSAQALVAELRESAGLIDIKIGLSAQPGYPGNGSTIRIEPAGILYTNVQRADCERIIRSTIVKGIVLPEFLPKDPRTGKYILHETDTLWFKTQTRLVSGTFAETIPDSLSSVLNHGGYRGTIRALGLRPEEILSEIKASRLRGRGGEGIPTWRKLEAVAAELSFPKMIVTVVDSTLAESVVARAPHRVLEGMTIAARAVGATKGILVLRDCTPYTIRICEKAIRDAESNRLLGIDILDSGQRFTVTLMHDPIDAPKGDISAILATLKGQPALPRTLPPFAAERGSFGKPTVLLDARTVICLPTILTDDVCAFADTGTNSGGGTQFASIQYGHRDPILIEIPIGRRLDVLLMNTFTFEERKRIKAVRLGEIHGCYLAPGNFTLPLDEASFEKIGAPLSANIRCILDNEPLLPMIRAEIEDAATEACARCQTCSFGLEAIAKKIASVEAGQAGFTDLLALNALAEGVRDSAVCRFGRDATLPILSGLAFFYNEFESAIKLQKPNRSRIPINGATLRPNGDLSL